MLTTGWWIGSEQQISWVFIFMVPSWFTFHERRNWDAALRSIEQRGFIPEHAELLRLKSTSPPREVSQPTDGNWCWVTKFHIAKYGFGGYRAHRVASGCSGCRLKRRVLKPDPCLAKKAMTTAGCVGSPKPTNRLKRSSEWRMSRQTISQTAKTPSERELRQEKMIQLRSAVWVTGVSECACHAK